MKTLAVICSLLALFVVPAMAPLMAQDQPPTDQGQTSSEQTEPVKVKKTYETPKFEISAGYSYRSFYSKDLTSLGMNGWYVSFDDNLKRWIGVVGEAAVTGENQGITPQGILGDTHVYTFLIGPEIYPLGHRKLSPFGHIFYGAGYYRNVTPIYGGYLGQTTTSLTRLWEAGGGLDLNLSQHWGVRLVQVDFSGGNFFPNSQNYTNRVMHRVSVGVVYRFGQR